MKIALSSSGKNLESNLDLRFGRCPYFIVYNLEKDDFYVLDNKGLTASGGAGIAAAQQLIDENVDIVISNSPGPNAYNLLSSSNIQMYKGDILPCKDLIEFYKDGKLEKIKEAGSSHSHGGKK